MNNWLLRCYKYGTLICTYLLLATVLFQIFGRLLLAKPPAWTEEFARICFLYSVAFAAGLALKSGHFIHFDLLFQQFSNHWKRRISFVIDLSQLVLFTIVGAAAVQWTYLGWMEKAPTLRWSMSYSFFAIVILALLLVWISGKSLGEKKKVL